MFRRGPIDGTKLGERVGVGTLEVEIGERTLASAGEDAVHEPLVAPAVVGVGGDALYGQRLRQVVAEARRSEMKAVGIIGLDDPHWLIFPKDGERGCRA